MKTLLLATLTSMTLTAHAEFDKCPVKVMETTGTILVVPHYSATVSYMFDDTEKEAYGNVEWKMDRIKTHNCIEEVKKDNPGKQVEMAYTNTPKFYVNIFKSNKYVEMKTYQESPAIYYGQASLIPVDYAAKADILKGIKNNSKMVTLAGEFFYRYQEQIRKVGGYLPCVNGDVSGVPALHKRLSEMTKFIDEHEDEKVNRDELLEEFMGTCVEIKDVASTGLSGLSRKVNLKKGDVPYKVTDVISAKGVIPAFTEFESSYIEY